MSKKRIFYDGRGKGEWVYDYGHDILTLKIKNLNYEYSLDFENYVVDFDPEGIVKGVQIWDASQVFDIPKSALREISSFQFLVGIQKGIIHIRILLIAKTRNKEFKIQQDIERVLEEEQTPLEVSCTMK